MSEAAELVRLFDWAALRRTPNVWPRNATYDTRTGSFLESSGRFVGNHVVPVLAILRSHCNSLNSMARGLARLPGVMSRSL